MRRPRWGPSAPAASGSSAAREPMPAWGAPWGDHPVPAGDEVTHLLFGPLSVWIRAVENEIWIAHERAEDVDGPSPGYDPGDPPPEEPDWHRWALQAGAHHLRILPALPDRMLVVKTEHPFTLLRKAEARIFMRVGVWVRIEAVSSGGGVASSLTEIPTELYSDTWWGDFRDGELAYWLTTKARRQVSSGLFMPHRAMCVLHLRNRSQTDLPVEKLALRVEHLSIFETEGRLWAEETVVDYQGDDLGSDIRMDDRPPREAAGAREITPARAQVRGFRARTFARLKAINPFSHGG